MKLTPVNLNDAKSLIASTTEGAKGTFEILKEAGETFLAIVNFFKELFTDPMSLIQKGIDGFQACVEPVVIITLAIIIILKMLGFKNIEKYGWLTLVVYLIIMLL